MVGHPAGKGLKASLIYLWIFFDKNYTINCEGWDPRTVPNCNIQDIPVFKYNRSYLFNWKKNEKERKKLYFTNTFLHI